MSAHSNSIDQQIRQYGSETGKKLTSWKAPDYHPYERGIGWYISFGLLTFGTSLAVYLSDPASSAIPVACICLMAAFYLWVHRDGEEEHKITLFENGLQVGDGRLMPWHEFNGYWFLQDTHSRLLVLESDLWNRDQIRLLLGKTKTDRIAKAMDEVELEHLPDRKERGFHLWSRVFRL